MQHHSPLKQQRSKQSLLHKTHTDESFLLRFFQSKQFIFPEFDQQLANAKFQSLQNFSYNYSQYKKDLKAWLLNRYPLSNYFKKILSQNPNITVLNTPFYSDKRHNLTQTIYIGQTSSEQKHGYGLQIILSTKSTTPNMANQDSSDHHQSVQFSAYEGFYSNSIKHGKGKLYTNINDSRFPVFYNGRFVNDKPNENKLALMIWKNNDFYIGKVTQNFEKQGKGILFISKQESQIYQQQIIRIDIKRDHYCYDKVVISDWQFNIKKSQPAEKCQFLSISQSLQKSQHMKKHLFNNSPYPLLYQTKIISDQEFYVGQAQVFQYQKMRSHVAIKQGAGQLKLRNGDIYQGSFSRDKIDGYGQYTWHNQNFYIGEFLSGKKHGLGFWKENTTNDQYEGEYADNKKQGNGEYRWGNGNLYKGNFTNDLRDGTGTMLWSTGEVYRGAWRDGLQNGLGTLYIAKGNQTVFIRESHFINGIEMESGENIIPLPKFLNQTFINSQSTKTRKSSHLQSSRSKQLARQKSWNKNNSSLPKIKEKTRIKFLNKSTQKLKFQTQPVQPDLERTNRLKKTSNFQSIGKQKSRLLNCKQALKLPYRLSASTLVSQTQKIQRKRISSLFSNQSISSKKKKTFYVEVQGLQNSKRKIHYQQNKTHKFQTSQLLYEDSSNPGKKEENTKTKDILADTFMIPIRWKNIRIKNHRFILQRKQRKESFDIQYK